MSGKEFYHSPTSTSQVALSDQDELDKEHGIASDRPPSSSGLRSPDGKLSPRDGYGGVNGDVVDDGESNLDCGWFGCRPGWLQNCKKAPCLLVSLCFATIFQGMIVNGFTPASITSIERRFQLTSQSTGILISVYDFTNIIFVLFVVYVGGRGHKIRWTGVGCILIGLSGIMYALPHFTTPPYSYGGGGSGGGNSSSGPCDRNGSDGGNDTCTASDGASNSGLSNYIYLFCAAQVVAGLGSLPLYSLALTALDESVSNKAYGPYFGTFFACVVLGPGIGFILSGSLLNIFTELSKPDGADPLDPGWVGAWWLGFIIIGVITLIMVLPLTLFPRELPTTAQIRAEKAVQAHAKSGLDETTRAGFGEHPSDLLRALKYLFTNPTFVFTCLGGVADALLINGFNAFLPKFIENQFSVAPGLATILTGVLTIFGGIFGSLSAGFVLKRFKLMIPGVLRLIAGLNFVSGCLLLTFLWYCPQQELAGVTVSYTNGTRLSSDINMNLTSLCNSDCSCAENQFLPVCDENINYFTPCHAGCETDFGNGSYTDCSCLQEPTRTVYFGLCKTSCSYHPYVFTVIAAINVLIVFFAQIPELSVVLRCVPDSQRSMALGVSSLLKRGLGKTPLKPMATDLYKQCTKSSVPGPILFGAVIDQACILWQDVCGTRGSCWLYDNASLGWRMTVIAVSLKAAAICMYLIAMTCYRPAVTDDKELEQMGERENGGATFD